MKRFLLSLLLILCFNTTCRGDCREQIKTFYTAYIENVLHDNSRNEELCRSYLTEELLEKVDRLINATNVDPLIRAQDASLDAIETLNIEPLIKNWYMVRYYWDKKDSTTIKEIPIKAQSINGKCLITYITPIWSESHYGDELISCKSRNSLHINQETAQAFLESFYKLYIAEYSEMPKDLSSKLALLRKRHLSEDALAQYKNAECENLMDGHRGYDLLIDNYDFDRVWSESLKFKQLNDNDYLVSYMVKGKIYKIVISIKKNGNEYIANEIKVIK